MAKSIEQSFLQLKQNLEITSLQSSTVSTRQKNVREALDKELEIHETFLTGSYSRSTMIAPLSKADVDIFAVLPAKYFHHYDGKNGGQGGLLDLIKRAIQRTYPSTPRIGRNGQAVSITFTDFVVDVVPGFNMEGGGYIIPNSITSSWLRTDPTKHVDLFAAANKAHSGTLVPMAKMIKGWNKQNSEFFRSFHLEVLALGIFNNVTISDYPSGARFFFGKAHELIDKKNLDPAGYGDDIGRYINDGNVSDARSRLATAYNRSVKAEKFSADGKIESAVDEWRKVFGEYFPAYG